MGWGGDRRLDAEEGTLMPADADLPEVGDVVRRGGQARFDLDSVPANPNAAPDPTGPSRPRVQDHTPSSGSHEATRPASPIPPVEPPRPSPAPQRGNPSRQPSRRGRFTRKRASYGWAAPGLVILAIALASNPPGATTSSEPAVPRQAAPVPTSRTIELEVPTTDITLSTAPAKAVSLNRSEGCSLGRTTDAARSIETMRITCADTTYPNGLDITVPEGASVVVRGGTEVKASGRYRSLGVSGNSDAVELTHVQGDLQVRTEGKVEGTVASASRVDVVSSDGKDVDLEFVDRVENATITTAKKGSVKLQVAPNSVYAYDLDLDAHGGKIESAFPDNAGMPNLLTVTTAGGKIELR